MKNINGNHVGLRLAILGWMLCTMLSVHAQNVRETIRLDEGWKFSLGNAADPAKDYGCGTEYFNYLTKANSILGDYLALCTSGQPLARLQNCRR